MNKQETIDEILKELEAGGMELLSAGYDEMLLATMIIDAYETFSLLGMPPAEIAEQILIVLKDVNLKNSTKQ